MESHREEFLKIFNSIDFQSIKDHPNILIAAEFWEKDRYCAAKICYRFMRTIDDMIDNHKAANKLIAPGERKEFVANVNDWLKMIIASEECNPMQKELIEIIEKFKIPLWPLEAFAKSMIYDINNDGFPTLDSFLNYAQGASVAPASIFVHLNSLAKKNGIFERPAFDVREAATPCSVFSYLVHIIRDFQKDQLNNLNYFPLDILEKNQLSPSDLKRIARGAHVPDSFRNVIREYCGYAENYRLKTIEQLDKLTKAIEPRYLLSLYVIYNLYLQVFERIEAEKGTFTTAELNPEPNEIRQRVAEIIIKNKHLFREYFRRS